MTARDPPGDDLCVATLAVGSEYTACAKLLARDLLDYHANLEFLVLTDSPREFIELPNVHASRFRTRGIRSVYHDKRSVIEAGLESHATCVFLDADCRLLSEIDLQGIARSEEKLVAGHVIDLPKKIDRDSRVRIRFHLNRPRRVGRMIQGLAFRLGADFNSSKYVYEVFLAVKRDDGRERSFLDSWRRCARYLSLRGLEFYEGAVIGLCAEKVGWKVKSLQSHTAWLFKDLSSYLQHQEEGVFEQFEKSRHFLQVRREIARAHRPGLLQRARRILLPGTWALRYFRLLGHGS